MSLIASVLGSVASSVVGGMMSGKKKQQSGAGYSFMDNPDLDDFGYIKPADVASLKDNESDPAEVAPLWDWTRMINGISVDDISQRAGTGKKKKGK